MGRIVNLTDVIKCCETRFGRGESAQWTHSDFIDLNQDILGETKVNISINTLKRIFGKLAVDKKYIPQYATIEALQKYCGYASPEDIQSPPEDIQSPPEAIQSPVEAQVSDTKPVSKHKKNLILYLIAFVLIGISGYAAWRLLKPAAPVPADITLLKVEGAIPFTAVFDILVPDTQDSAFVDFGDKSPLIHVRPEQKRISHNYLYAGVFNVSLRSRRTIFAETAISVSSNKWIALCYHDQIRNHYYEIPAVRTGPDSLFNLTNRQLHSIGLDTVKRIFTRLYNYTPVDYFEDDFTFETTFKNPPRKDGFSCNSTQFQVSGMNSMIRFKLSNPGCSSRVINVLSEQRFDGDKEDLSEFVLEQENWSTVKMINRNKQVSLFVNGKLLFQGSYQKPLGEIKGLFIEFEGNGFVKKCELKASNGLSLYQF